MSSGTWNAHRHHDSNPERGEDHFGHARMLARFDLDACARHGWRACVNSISSTDDAREGHLEPCMQVHGEQQLKGHG